MGEKNLLILFVEQYINLRMHCTLRNIKNKRHIPLVYFRAFCVHHFMKSSTQPARNQCD